MTSITVDSSFFLIRMFDFWVFFEKFLRIYRVFNIFKFDRVLLPRSKFFMGSMFFQFFLNFFSVNSDLSSPFELAVFVFLPNSFCCSKLIWVRGTNIRSCLFLLFFYRNDSWGGQMMAQSVDVISDEFIFLCFLS